MSFSFPGTPKRYANCARLHRGSNRHLVCACTANDQLFEKLGSLIKDQFAQLEQNLDKKLDEHGKLLEAHGRLLEEHGKQIEDLARSVQSLSEDGDREKVARYLGEAFGKRVLVDAPGKLLYPYISDKGGFDPSEEGFQDYNDAMMAILGSLTQDNAGGCLQKAPLDDLYESVLDCLNRLSEDGKLGQGFAKGTQQGEIGPFLGENVLGNYALYEKIRRLKDTQEKRNDTRYLLSCRSYSLGLLLFSSSKEMYREAVKHAKSTEDLAKAMPPQEIEIDCKGRLYVLGDVLHIEVAEIKHTTRSSAVRAGAEQLNRALLGIKYAATISQQHLPRVIGNFQEVVLVGYICIPRNLTEKKGKDELGVAQGPAECIDRVNNERSMEPVFKLVRF